MKKKPPPRLPPLSLEALSRVEEIERAASSTIGLCSDPVRMMSNEPRLTRVLRTCAVELLSEQFAYYDSLPTYHPGWEQEIAQSTVDSLLGLFPTFVPPDPYRPELVETINEYLEKRFSQREQQTATVAPPSNPTTAEPLSGQLEALRTECRMTVEDLAEGLDVAPRSVYRHLSGEAAPRQRQIAAYEKLFSQRLGRKVRLETSSKRQ